MMYGRNPPNLRDYMTCSTNIQNVEETLTERSEVLKELRWKLAKAQETMKNVVDRARIHHHFAVGDLVFVKLRPHRQNSVEGQMMHKLSKRFYGSLKIMKAMGEFAFQLEILTSRKIHLVFHMFQLKPWTSDTMSLLELPPEVVENQPPIQPLVVLD